MNPAILLIEDDENDVIFTTMALKKAGVTCPISIAKDGRQAIDYLSGERQFSDRAKYPLPSLILLDLKLPRVMGLEVLRWLREREEFDATIVLVLTSSQQPEDMRAAYRLRANGYVVKPSGLEKLHPLAQSINDFWLNHNQVEPRA